MSLKVVFFGTSAFGLEALEALASEHNILQVFTNPPKEAGRGKALQKSPIQLKAEQLGLKVVNSSKPKPSEIEGEFDVGVVVSYGSIISKEVLGLAKYGFLNIHPSNLPKFRGAAPIERSLEAGETQTRVCVIKMTPKLDDGNILACQEYLINPEETSLDLHTKFAKIGAELLKPAIEALQNQEEGEKQEEALATYAPKIKKEELELKANTTTCQEAINKIRAFASYGYVFTTFNGKRIKIKSAKITKTQETILDVKCKDGFISPLIIKPEGKNFMAIKDFLNSYP